ncbi:hypothetical protein GR11A_00136 [Vibrio phage vB_VcorM_GR11A]|nr:hypothetical protein GR11A_00136 [Vibrio phage vB_VcorM_GR11A]
MNDINFKVLTKDTVTKLLDKEGADFLYLALSWDDYLALGKDMQDILAYVKGTNALLCYYRKDLAEAVCSEVDPDEKNPKVENLNDGINSD